MGMSGSAASHEAQGTEKAAVDHMFARAESNAANNAKDSLQDLDDEHQQKREVNQPHYEEHRVCNPLGRTGANGNLVETQISLTQRRKCLGIIGNLRPG